MLFSHQADNGDKLLTDAQDVENPNEEVHLGISINSDIRNR